jgi:hypothetical protein
MYFSTWRMNLRLIASVVTALLAIGGGVGALASYTDYLPATRGYAKEVAKKETDSALMVATARIGNLQRESSETRLQLNQIRLDGLRIARSNWSQQLDTTKDAHARQLFQQQIDGIDDTLRDAYAERDRLKYATAP